MIRLMVYLSNGEYQALQKAAKRALRETRAEANWLVRKGLIEGGFLQNSADTIQEEARQIVEKPHE